MRAPDSETLLNVYRKRRGVTLAGVAKIVGKSTAQAQRYCLPRDHADYTPPPREVEARILKWSGGKITFANHADLWTAEGEAALGGFSAPAASVAEDVQ